MIIEEIESMNTIHYLKLPTEKTSGSDGRNDTNPFNAEKRKEQFQKHHSGKPSKSTPFSSSLLDLQLKNHL